MKIEQMDTTKEAVKSYLDDVASKAGIEWHSQAAHKIAVGMFFLDCLGVTEQADRDAVMKQWGATPSSFGANASAMAQQLGRESKANKTEKTFAGF